MKWQSKWLTPQAINYYFDISLRSNRKTFENLRNTQYAKKSSVKCGNWGYYWLYDMEYLVDVLGLKPAKPIPEHLIKS